MKNKLLKLLRQNISFPQLAGYAFAALTGMSILFAAFCFSRDVSPLFKPVTGLFKPEYMIVNKKVSLLSAFNSNLTTFSKEEIDEISQQNFVSSVSYFTPGMFRVKAYTNASSQIPSFSTDLFFESVPDNMLDSYTPQWKWNEQSGMIPVIIPRDYLNLYNFGFAGSQGLPQISEAIVQQVSFRVLVSGNGKQQFFDGHIAGFSDYLNTILVPDAFMQWANSRFGEGAENKISRLIIETHNPADPAITEFFSTKQNYDISDKAEQGKLSYFLRLIITIVLIIGVLIMLPAIGLMLLSINLLVYKNRKTLGNLLLLGYRRKRLALPYCLLALLLNVTVGLISLFIAGYAQNIYAPKLATIGITALSGGFLTTATFAAIFVISVTALDILWIWQNINKIKTPAKR